MAILALMEPKIGVGGLHLVAKMKSRLLQFSDIGWEIGDLQHDAIPPARFLLLSVRHWPRARCAGTTQQNLCITKRDVCERRELLVFERSLASDCILVHTEARSWRKSNLNE